MTNYGPGLEPCGQLQIDKLMHSKAPDLDSVCLHYSVIGYSEHPLTLGFTSLISLQRKYQWGLSLAMPNAAHRSLNLLNLKFCR